MGRIGVRAAVTSLLTRVPVNISFEGGIMFKSSALLQPFMKVPKLVLLGVWLPSIVLFVLFVWFKVLGDSAPWGARDVNGELLSSVWQHRSQLVFALFGICAGLGHLVWFCVWSVKADKAYRAAVLYVWLPSAVIIAAAWLFWTIGNGADGYDEVGRPMTTIWWERARDTLIFGLAYTGLAHLIWLWAWWAKKANIVENNTSVLPNVEEREERKEEKVREEKEEEKEREVDLSLVTALGRDGSGLVVVDDVLRQSGCYVLGVQGVGKSSLLEQMIYQDIYKGFSVIVLDPHGDLINHALAQMPEERLKDVSLLSIEDAAYPFGLNLFSSSEGANEIEQSQALDRVMHVFEKCFPETSRMLLEKYLGNIAPVFFAHADAGYGMTDIPTFLLDDAFREKLIKKSRLFVRRFWETDYGTMSPSVRRSETGSLSTRLNRFMRSPIVGNIIGQGKTTIDFRKAIENKEIIFVRLPVKTLKDDATLIGTMLVAQIHAAIFSFADMRLEDRPGFSLYVDEFQHFCSSDFAEMFTEGRKFGSRVTVANQFMGQLPDYLASATMTARTKVTFQTTQEDAPKLAPVYLDQKGKAEVAVDPKPADKLAKYASDNPQFPEVEAFVNLYLRPMRSWSKGGKVEYLIDRKVVSFDDPSPQLNDLLYRVQKRRDCMLDIPQSLIYGFCGCGKEFFGAWEYGMKNGDERRLILSADILFPQEVVERVRDGDVRNNHDEFWRFLWCLRRTMLYLSQKPIGEEKHLSAGEVVQQIINLPRRHALVKVGNDVHEIMTLDAPEAVSPSVFDERRRVIVEQTRKKYCRPAGEVEREIEKRLGIEDVVSDGVVALDVEEQKPDAGKPSDNGDGGGEKKRKRIIEVDDE
jgi:hypothetical protein